MVEQALAGGGKLDAAAAAVEQRDAERFLHAPDPGARRGQRQIRAIGAARDAAAVRDRNEEIQVDQVEAHGSARAFATAEGCLRNLHIVPDRGIGQCRTMSVAHSMLYFIAGVFLVAGFVKGVVGLGLPTVSMGLLAVTMPPSQALTIVIVPAVITNIWQTFAGGYLRDIFRRLWPMLVGTALGVWLNRGSLTGSYAHYIPIALGALLVIYGIIGLTKFKFAVAPHNEKWVGGIVGVITGVISAATGVQVIPSMPFLQAIGMDKDELVQALGVFFTVATLGLTVNLTSSGLLRASTALPGAIAMAGSFAGMLTGQAVRSRMPAEAFRRWFLIAMIFLGIYLAGAAIYKLYAGA